MSGTAEIATTGVGIVGTVTGGTAESAVPVDATMTVTAITTETMTVGAEETDRRLLLPHHRRLRHLVPPPDHPLPAFADTNIDMNMNNIQSYQLEIYQSEDKGYDGIQSGKARV